MLVSQFMKDFCFDICIAIWANVYIAAIHSIYTVKLKFVLLIFLQYSMHTYSDVLVLCVMWRWRDSEMSCNNLNNGIIHRLLPELQILDTPIVLMIMCDINSRNLRSLV